MEEEPFKGGPGLELLSDERNLKIGPIGRGKPSLEEENTQLPNL